MKALLIFIIVCSLGLFGSLKVAGYAHAHVEKTYFEKLTSENIEKIPIAFT